MKLDAIRGIVEKASKDNAARNSYAYFVVEEILEVLGQKPGLEEKLRKLVDDHYTNIPYRKEVEDIELYESVVVAYISKYHDKVLEALDE